MVRSGLPVPSLLGLLAALLMLPPVLLKEKTGGIYDVPVYDSGVQRSLPYALNSFNRNRHFFDRFFKILHVLNARMKEEDGVIIGYHLQLEMVETICPKRFAVPIDAYTNIQQCKQRLNPKKEIFEFDIHAPFRR